jgi:hypothetical protein
VRIRLSTAMPPDGPERDAGRLRQADVRPHAEPQDHQVRGQPLPVGRVDSDRPAVRTGLHARGRLTEHEADAQLGHGLGDEAADVGVERADRRG